MPTSPDLHPTTISSTGEETPHPQPVLITGITPRSGTNYLHRLLSLHPDCASLEYDPVQEDFLLHHSDALADYADRLSWQWGHWGDPEPARENLFHHLGQGLTNFLEPEHEASLVLSKTPSVRNVHRFFDLFPQGYLLVLVRDGRSVVASAMEGFHWPFERTARQWTRNARRVLDLQRSYGHASNRHRILYYEELNEQPVASLERLLDFLPLEIEAYDFSEALDLPVYGSSFIGNEDDEVTWSPKKKPDTFGSKMRWADWSDERHARFNWIGGEELARLGYRPVETSLTFLDRLHHWAADLQYEGSQLPTRLRQSARAGVNSFLEAFQEHPNHS